VPDITGIIHQKKKKYLLALVLSQAFTSFFLLLIKNKYISITQQLTVTIDFHVGKRYYGSQWHINCWVIKIYPFVFRNHTGLEQLEGE